MLVKQHMTPSDPLACAIKDVASAQKTTFATTQAVWRFLNNDRIAFSQLNEPIIALAREEITRSAHQYALVAHDWSRLHYAHPSKEQRRQMTHKTDVGYELRSSLLIDAASGLPVAPLGQTLTDSTYCHSTLNDARSEPLTHLDALTADITRLEALGFDKKMVHIIDREGDSIGHMRTLSEQGFYWLIRGKEGHRVQYQGKTKKVGEVADELRFQVQKTVNYKGKKAHLAVSETGVSITRAAQSKQKDKDTNNRVPKQPGKALAVRLVVVRLSDDEGKELGRWTLLTNTEEAIRCDEIAQWYYWRWNIESFFKLLKSAGHDVGSWLQRSARAILRRLLIASMACVLVWRLQRSEGEENARARRLICRLSGRQQKRGRLESAPALLAGLSILLNTLMLLSEYTPEELTLLAARALGQLGDV
ncbi:hypothetical protein Xkoz_03827 [Xenorhabdus kozodoii]|uniref:Transposase IS4-like domain-containing protein n=2 Tax=Xenorhabdus kozodoii TaxID=351676 RepID=A0A2D0KT08_9GAMM|nr:transposase [Xenorhabdus kozodoii]PHM66596.1 hypothetical protein Xkoz_03827 [Xenorhabdus kozodoii]